MLRPSLYPTSSTNWTTEFWHVGAMINVARSRSWPWLRRGWYSHLRWELQPHHPETSNTGEVNRIRNEAVHGSTRGNRAAVESDGS